MAFQTLGFKVPNVDIAWLAGLGEKHKEIVEVGSFVGLSAAALSHHGATVHCIDTWEGSEDLIEQYYEELGRDFIFRTFCNNAGKKLFKTIFPHVGTSEFYASIWPHQVDAVFIDASHDYDSVKKDIEIWRPHIRPGGVLCGHDYGVVGAEGVKKAVDEDGLNALVGNIWIRYCK